jgi:hypothetical protein
MTLSTKHAARFFGSLYDRSHAPDLGDFEAAALRLVARVENGVPTKDTAAGDKALGVLMLNHVMTTPDVDSSTRAALSAAALMNIKSELVARFVDTFPDMNLDQLLDAARDAGYQVEVLDPEVAERLPRSIVGR